MPMSRIVGILMAGLSCLPLIAVAAPGALSRKTAMQAEPRDDASALRQLDKGASVEVLSRNGAWYKIDANGQQGWVRLYWVRTGGAHVERAATGAVGQPLHSISDTLSLATARRNRSQIGATMGVRGMSEEDLKAAHYDAAQMTRLDGNAVSNDDASKFAAAGPVRRRSIDELGTGETRSRRR